MEYQKKERLESISDKFSHDDTIWLIDELRNAWAELEKLKNVHCHHQLQSDARGDMIDELSQKNAILLGALRKIEQGPCCLICECHACDAKQALTAYSKV